MSNAGAWPQLPSWETSTLQSLGSAGDLYGVTPRAIAVIDKEESGGTPGINPQGFGGFFGEGVGTSYPGGTATRTLLEARTQQAFTDQAEISASAFASYLIDAGGTYVRAEEIYQTGPNKTGPTPGSNLFVTYGFGGAKATTSALGKGAVTTGWLTVVGKGAGLLFPHSTTITGKTQTPGVGTIGAAIGGAEKSFTTYLAETVFVVAGVALVVLGAWRLAKPKGESGGPSILPAGLDDLSAADLGAVAA